MSNKIMSLIYNKNILMQGSTTEMQNNKSSVGGYLKYLPKDPQQRNQLKEAIQNSLNRLKRKMEKKPQNSIQQKIRILELRLLMIESCAEMSLLRLDHLQWIFKHYCIHIFKTGKHMTFQRLQYQKVHLTMERFFLFLKDFELTMMKNGDKKEEVVDKNTIILLFKKMSSTCRDLSFEEFIRCLQKLAIVYYDEKLVFYQKKDKLKQEKQKRKQDYEKKKAQRLKKKQGKEEQKKQGEQQGQEQQQNVEQNQQKQKQQGQENDELIKDLMNDKELEDPNQQINKITNRYALEEEQGQITQGQNKNTNFSQMDDDSLLLLTNEEKIQYYYKFMINVDSVKDYRDKLTALNLPIFQKGKSMAKQASNSSQKNVKTSEDQNARMQQLKKKMDEKKLKQKASPIPKPKQDGAWVKAQQEKRKKRQVKKQREQKAKQKNKVESDALIQKKLDSQKSVKQKKPEYNEKELDWNTLGKMSIDQLKMNKFNPNRYFSKDDDDKIFLDEYEGGRNRIASGMERQRNSLSVVQDVKKRVGQVQKKQKKQEKDLQKKLGQNVPIKGRF